MKEIYMKMLNMSDDEEKRREYMKKLAFMLECANCKGVTTHRFVELGSFKKCRLKCLRCNHIGYSVYKMDFDEHYIKGNVGLTEIRIRKERCE